MTTRSVLTNPTHTPINWNQFPIKNATSASTLSNSKITNVCLKNTRLSCSTDVPQKEWKCRQLFIENIYQKIVASCPLDQPLVIISLGSDRLLCEYVLGVSLIQYGFKNIHFFLVDPAYVFSDPKEQDVIQGVLTDFRTHIEAAYNKKYSQPLDKNRICYLSRGQKVEKYMIPQANAVMMEIFPPYSANLMTLEQFSLEKKSAELLMAGGFILNPKALEHANSIAFMPNRAKLQEMGATFVGDLPLGVFRNNTTGKPTYSDWGCKIDSKGHFYLCLSGIEDYFTMKGLKLDQRVQIQSGEIIAVRDFFDRVKNQITHMLNEKIQNFLIESSDKVLSQKQKIELLNDVKAIFDIFFPNLPFYFTADYSIDRQEAIAIIASKAGPYAKSFSLHLSNAASPETREEPLQ